MTTKTEIRYFWEVNDDDYKYGKWNDFLLDEEVENKKLSEYYLSKDRPASLFLTYEEMCFCIKELCLDMIDQEALSFSDVQHESFFKNYTFSFSIGSTLQIKTLSLFLCDENKNKVAKCVHYINNFLDEELICQDEPMRVFGPSPEDGIRWAAMINDLKFIN